MRGGWLGSAQSAVLRPIFLLPTSGIRDLEVKTQLPAVGRRESNFRLLEVGGWKSEVDIYCHSVGALSHRICRVSEFEYYHPDEVVL